jgi:hypothetical protein
MIFILPAVLIVTHGLQPIDHLPIEPLLDSDVRHRRRGRRPVPVLLARREPDHVARMDLLDRAALPLDPAAAGRDDERLTQGVGMPGRPAPGLEGDGVAGRTGQSAGPLADGCDPTLVISISSSIFAVERVSACVRRIAEVASQVATVARNVRREKGMARVLARLSLQGRSSVLIARRSSIAR